MLETVIIKPAVVKQFERFMQQGRVLFFSAPCGFGKTLLAEELLKGRKVLRKNAGAADFSFAFLEEDWEILLLDDLHQMQEESDWQTLCDFIRTAAQRRFVLLSRGSPPGCLVAFQYAGLMTVLEADDLLFDREDIRRLFQAHRIALTDSELSEIQKESIGYPLGLAITARYLADGRPYSAEITARVFREVFSYFETAVYKGFDLPVRRFLLELAPFESFDLEMARMVSGDAHAGERLDWLLRYTSMLRCEGVQHFRFWSEFRAFLCWQMEREYTEEKRRLLFDRGGLYYELKEDFANALDCYTKGGDYSKVSELLVRNAQMHPGMGHYSEMEKYYRSLPEEEILASPSLMQGMSMLCALVMDYEGSERWYHALEEFAKRCGKQDAAGRQARGRVAWLDISLPQRGVDSLTETIPAAFRLMGSKEVTLPPFSVTSTMPSIMNGGKDFSPWSRMDDLLYQTIRIPVEAVLGKDGVGLADCALAESKFEKGEDISARMLSLIPRMSEIRNHGTPDIEFAIGGLLARSQFFGGQPEDAERTILSMRERFIEGGLTRFLPNMDAMLCRLWLHCGRMEDADAWYQRKAPRNLLHLNVMKRYQYLTQAMVELANGKPDAALMTLLPLEPYIESCARYIDGIHLHMLCAVALYRKKDGTWKQRLGMALDTAEKFRFIRPVSIYGTAILPLLEDFGYKGRQNKWYRQLLAQVRTQASFYPAFLQPRLALQDALTPMELQILHLICADKSNAEIGRMLDIKLPTVKTHVSHILGKLDVSRRSEAKTVAKKLRLVPEEF